MEDPREMLHPLVVVPFHITLLFRVHIRLLCVISSLPLFHNPFPSQMFILRVALVASLSFSIVVCASVSTSDLERYSVASLAGKNKRYTGGLNDAAKAAGKLYFGTATDPVSFGDAAYMRVLNNTGDFGGISVENAMKVCFGFYHIRK